LVPLAALVNDLELKDLVGFIRYLTLQITKLGVTIRLGKEVNTSVIDELKPDVVILAAGGKPAVVAIPGINRRNVIRSSALHHKLKIYGRFLGPKAIGWLLRLWMPIGKRVIIIGGAIQGCGLAEFLMKRHRKVTIVNTNEVLGEGMTEDNRRRLFRWFDEKGVAMSTKVKYEEITGKGLVITDKEGRRITLESDTVVLIEPLQPNTEMIRRLEGVAPEVYAIGDCRDPHLIAKAVTDGWKIGHRI
jgi:2,4-dienoyl-CoA reductase (NADPH2)